MKNMLRFKTVFILAIFSIVFYANAEASLFPPNCVCEVKAKVLEVKETPVEKDASSTEDLISLGMKIEIIGVERMVSPGISEKMTCDTYEPGKIMDVNAVKPTDFIDKNQAINAGSIIKAYIEYSGDENGFWYNFNHIEETKK